MKLYMLLNCWGYWASYTLRVFLTDLLFLFMVIGCSLPFYGRISKNTFYVKSSRWRMGFVIKIAEFTTLCKEIITVPYRMLWIIEGFSLTLVTKYTHLCKELIIEFVYVQHLFMLKYDRYI